MTKENYYYMVRFNAWNGLDSQMRQQMNQIISIRDGVDVRFFDVCNQLEAALEEIIHGSGH